MKLHRIFLLAAFCFSIGAQTRPKTLTLDQAIQEATAGNLDLVAARYGVRVAEARQITARLRPNPLLTVGGDHLDALGTGFSSINAAGPAEYALRTDFIFEAAGKRAARMELAGVEKAVAEHHVKDAVRRLTFEVEGAFVDLQLAKERLTLAQDNQRTLNALVDINRERVRTGDLAGVELERSRLAAMQYDTAVKQAQLQVRDSKLRLQALLGRRDFDSNFDVTGPIRRDTAPVALEDLRKNAYASRPDLLEVRQVQIRNQVELHLQMAQGKVDYDIGVEYRRQQGINGRANTLGLFFLMPIPVFNRNQGEIARAQHETAQAMAQLRAQEARVNTEITSAWEQYSTSRSMLEDIEQRMLDRAKDVRNTTEYSYRRGEASLIEFLDAQRAFNEVMQSYNEARAGYARSLYLIDSVAARPLIATP